MALSGNGRQRYQEMIQINVLEVNPHQNREKSGCVTKFTEKKATKRFSYGVVSLAAGLLI